ncbi:MAG: patatin-like phospholipase family protein [Cyclobacteriaceae bacterium]|jgi:NTE family protein|nr:patatin-like phospholipase family protein [Cyclobacteriaceae bacterium]
MMRRLVFIFIGVWMAWATSAQRVGVALSGGAAKGIAHVGVLKALEENEIPIDYIAGTSMGGIVGGCYAAGMSPAQIEEIVLSKEFLNWVNGQLESGQSYYYFKNDEDASFLRLNLSLDSTREVLFNNSLANDLSLNFALAEKMAQPSAISNGNFDSLFIPLRVVAADVFTQTQVILKRGSLSDAMRATQTVPFFYNPIRVEGKYLFDGGVYNNFPVDVIQQEFEPEVVIGCNVSSKIYQEYPYGEDEKLISRSLLYMLLDKSDPAKVPASGVYIQPNITNYTAFDFAKARALIDSGYAQTMRQMPEIKAKIARRIACEAVADNRNRFNSRTPPLLVDKIRFQNFNTRQQRYINRFFKQGKRPLYFSDIKEGYYRLVSEDYFNNVFPGFRYDTATSRFDFLLSRRPANNFQVDFGGVIATRSISHIYLGANYYYFNRALTHANVNFYAGNFYKALQLKARIDIPRLGSFYVEPEGSFNNWDFAEGRDVVFQNFQPTVLQRTDRRVGATVAWPVGKQYKAMLHGYYINNTDRFFSEERFSARDTLDVQRLRGFKGGVSMSSNTLNRKQYASTGRAYRFQADWFDLNETFQPGSVADGLPFSRELPGWGRLKLSAEQYFRKGVYSSGYLVEGMLSNQPLLANYQGSIINATAFNPLQDSRTLLLENFRAYSYVAGGWRNVVSVRKSLDFRLEAYVFKPFQSLARVDGQRVRLNEDITEVYFAGTAGFVLHTSVGPVSLSANYYDDDQTRWGVLLHVGFLLFNKTSLE